MGRPVLCLGSSPGRGQGRSHGDEFNRRTDSPSSQEYQCRQHLCHTAALQHPPWGHTVPAPVHSVPSSSECWAVDMGLSAHPPPPPVIPITLLATLNNKLPVTLTLQNSYVQYQPVHTEIACEHTLLAASLKPLPSQTTAFKCTVLKGYGASDYEYLALQESTA